MVSNDSERRFELVRAGSPMGAPGVPSRDAPYAVQRGARHVVQLAAAARRLRPTDETALPVRNEKLSGEHVRRETRVAQLL